MEPTIMTGDVIFIKPQAAYTVTDIVTFTDSQNHTITHRIIAQNDVSKTFTTKGDNNKTEDLEPISASQIIGKHILHLPKVGYILVYAQRPSSVFLLIAVPFVVLIAHEFFKTKPEKHDSKKL
jgi:signal peptidase